MSVLITAEAADVLEKVGGLYLNKAYSDVEFIVDGERLPAHRNILAQRCPIFKAIFSSNSELEKEVIEVPDTSLEAFKLLLKFIYVGTVEFGSDDIDDVFEMATTFEMPRLIEHYIDHLKSTCAVGNVVDILNKATEKSQETLIDHCIDYVCAHCAELIGHESFKKLPVKALHRLLEKPLSEVSAESIFCTFLIGHESFKKLPIKALQRVLEKPTSEVSADTIFRTFVEWMQANPSESEQFPELLKRMDLTGLEIYEIIDVIRPLNLVSDSLLLDLAYDHAKKLSDELMQHYKKTENILRPRSELPDSELDALINNDEYPTSYGTPLLTTFKHTIGIENEAITIDLDNIYKLNNVFFALSYGDWSYWVEVSKDNVNWTRVVDYSKYVCRGFQRLYFKTQLVRYIRICGTGPVGEIFKISRLEADHTMRPLEVDPETTVVVPSKNVAFEDMNAVLTQGGAYSPDGMINSAIESCSGHRIGEDPLIVQLPQPYILDNMNLLLSDDNSYSYNIEISTDKINWTRVFSEECVTSWRQIKFDKQPVVFVKLTGTYSTSTHFSCQKFECPAETKF
uniref:BTB domain-containing protein n=1 Tax=Panagrellus redivivus TaxID=6233 RepID=A0A7E4VI11_PANRE